MQSSKVVTPLAIVGVVIVLIAAAVSLSIWGGGSSGSSSSSSTSAGTPTSTTAPGGNPTTNAGQITSLTLDSHKDYGNKYASGLLPVGDAKYVTDDPKLGSVYLCNAPISGGGGAGSRGPWFVNNNTQYDSTQKITVAGNVSWNGNYSMSLTGGSRVVTTNDLPTGQTTGTFPIASSDPAYQYDRNPNTIKAQSLTYTLNANPQIRTQPACVSGEVGVMTTGIALFDAFDAGGRDAGAWEIQDHCGGHPMMQGEYHYHTLSPCIQDTGITTVIGYALDGFPITGPKVSATNILTTSDLDECHGITSTITLDGKPVTTYHYVMTQDFPYSVSCFRSTAAQAPRPG